MTDKLAASALAWWSDAGVDTLVAEEPRDWLKPKAPIAAQPASQPPPPPDALPDTLDAFHAWLANAPLPFPAVGPRLAPAGDPQCALMVMVPMPAPDGGWFEGEAGPLFDRMLSAMHGLSRDRIYLAPLASARPLSGQLGDSAIAGLGEAARHHAGLVKPRALLLFGDDCAEALLGGSVSDTRGRWHDLATPAGPVRTVATIRPEQIRGRAPMRKLAWDDLQLVMEELQ